MRVSGRFHRRYICFIWIMVFCVSATFAGAKGKVEEEKATVGLVEVKACEGVEITQCELAKNLINTLKMGEDLTCEACFIHLQALGISPGEDWHYEDPHRVVSMEEIKKVVLDVHGAYNNGTVRLDGFEAAGGLNRFCQDMKGPSATPAPSKTEKQEAVTETKPEAETATEAEPKAETEAATEPKTEAVTEKEEAVESEKETSATPPSQDASDKASAPVEETDQGKTPPAGVQEPDKQQETSE